MPDRMSSSNRIGCRLPTRIPTRFSNNHHYPHSNPTLCACRSQPRRASPSAHPPRPMCRCTGESSCNSPGPSWQLWSRTDEASHCIERPVLSRVLAASEACSAIVSVYPITGIPTIKHKDKVVTAWWIVGFSIILLCIAARAPCTAGIFLPLGRWQSVQPLESL